MWPEAGGDLRGVESWWQPRVWSEWAWSGRAAGLGPGGGEGESTVNKSFSQPSWEEKEAESLGGDLVSRGFSKTGSGYQVHMWRALPLLGPACGAGADGADAVDGDL